jgi:F0F1-type ATP synthase assembly protein I
MQIEDRKKADFYKWTKIWGLLSFVPVVLTAGPLAGYFLGAYLEKKIGHAPYLSLVFLAFGFFTSIREIIKILKLVQKTDAKLNKPKNPHDRDASRTT